MGAILSTFGYIHVIKENLIFGLILIGLIIYLFFLIKNSFKSKSYEAIGKPNYISKKSGKLLDSISNYNLKDCIKKCNTNKLCKHFTLCNNKCNLKTGSSKGSLINKMGCQMYFPQIPQSNWKPIVGICILIIIIIIGLYLFNKFSKNRTFRQLQGVGEISDIGSDFF
jgi:hypothetical protein